MFFQELQQFNLAFSFHHLMVINLLLLPLQMVCSDRTEYSCDNLCGNLLPCSNHYCTKTCHALKSQSSASGFHGRGESCEVCNLPCQKVRNSFSVENLLLNRSLYLKRSRKAGILEASPLCIFKSLWKERNSRPFENGELSIVFSVC